MSAIEQEAWDKDTLASDLHQKLIHTDSRKVIFDDWDRESSKEQIIDRGLNLMTDLLKERNKVRMMRVEQAQEMQAFLDRMNTRYELATKVLIKVCKAQDAGRKTIRISDLLEQETT